MGQDYGRQALFTHHHFGWRQHELTDSSDSSLIEALLATHDFLRRYEGEYRVEIKRTPEYSFDGVLSVYWDSDDPKSLAFGRALHRGDYWFKGFEFNLAPAKWCGYCGGTGVDHYSGPFFHCWACDGGGEQIRESAPRGFKHKPIAKGPVQ